MNSTDRYIRYAARLAIERNPVAEWQAKALAEKGPQAALTALYCLPDQVRGCQQGRNQTDSVADAVGDFFSSRLLALWFYNRCLHGYHLQTIAIF